MNSVGTILFFLCRFSRLCMTECYSFLCFIPPFMGISRGFPLPIGCWWHHYYIMPLSAEVLPLLDKSSNQRLSHFDSPLHMCFTIRSEYLKVHSSSIFQRGNILCSKCTKHSLHIMFLTHTFKVSACSLGAQCKLYLYFNIDLPHTYLAHVYTLTKVWLFFLKMVD